MGDDPMALLGLEGALKHYYYYYVMYGRDVSWVKVGLRCGWYWWGRGWGWGWGAVMDCRACVE
jgi:hypothetical protein